MSETMVEKVARAMEARSAVDPVDIKDIARAAIEAMREPTEAMGAAGLMAYSHDPFGGSKKISDEQAEKIGWADTLRANPSWWMMPTYRAMISAALHDPEGGEATVEAPAARPLPGP